MPGSLLTFIEILPVEGFSGYLFVFLGDIRTYVANFKMQEGDRPFFLALEKYKRAVNGCHSLLL